MNIDESSNNYQQSDDSVVNSKLTQLHFALQQRKKEICELKQNIADLDYKFDVLENIMAEKITKPITTIVMKDKVLDDSLEQQITALRNENLQLNKKLADALLINSQTKNPTTVGEAVWTTSCFVACLILAYVIIRFCFKVDKRNSYTNE